MTPQQTEDFSQRIAVALVSLIKFEGTPQEMDASAQAWVSRSRNLAKLWASKVPVSPEVASGLTSGKDLNQISLEELGQQNVSPEEAALLAQLPRRKKK